MKIFSSRVRFLAIAIGVILVWRGIWGLADIYLLPSKPELSFVVSIVVGLGILLAMHEKFSDLF